MILLKRLRLNCFLFLLSNAACSIITECGDNTVVPGFEALGPSMAFKCSKSRDYFIQLAIHALSYFDQTSLTMDYTSLPNLLCYVSGGSNLVRRGSCDSSSDSEHVSGAETYVSFTGRQHEHYNTKG